MRIRLRYTKLGKIRFLGHRDLARCWERAIRRAELPMAYSEGFSPRPKIHYGLALSTGCESYAEYLDLDVTETVDLTSLAERLSEGLPNGVDITGVAEVVANAEALQSVVERCTWEFELAAFNGLSGDSMIEPVSDAVAHLMSRDDVALTFERKGKSVTENIRPALLAASVGSQTRNETVVLTVDLATKPRSIRPTEFLSCIDGDLDVRRVCRREQWMTIDGETSALMAPSDTPWPVAARLAS